MAFCVVNGAGLGAIMISFTLIYTYKQYIKIFYINYEMPYIMF